MAHSAQPGTFRLDGRDRPIVSPCRATRGPHALDALPEWAVVMVVLAISAAPFAAVTALYRVLHRSKTSAQRSA